MNALVEAATASRPDFRRNAIDAFLSNISDSPLNDVDLEECWKLLSLAAPRLDLDGARLFQPALDALLRHNHAVKSFISELGPIITKLCLNDGDTSQRCICLQWTAYVWCNSRDSDRKENAKPFVKLFSLLGDSLMASPKKELSRLAAKYLKTVTKNDHALFRICLDENESIGAPCMIFLGVCLKHISKDEIVEHEQSLSKLYLNHVLTSKVAVPHSRIVAFDVLFSHISSATFSSFLPTIEKMFLRSPEVTLEPFSHILTFLPFDLPEMLKILTTPLLNLLKSSNSSVRKNALTSLHSLLLKSKSDEKIYFDNVDKVITANKGCLIDTKLAFYEALKPATAEQAQCALKVLCAWATKETSDQAISGILHVISKALVILHSNDAETERKEELMKTVNSVFKSGIESGKETTRVLFLNALRECLQSGKVQFGKEVESSVRTCIQNVLNAKNGANGVTSIPMDGYSAIYCLQQMNQADEILKTAANSSFVLNEKYYTKISSEEDWIIFCDVVSGSVKNVKDKWNAVGDFFVNAFFTIPKKMYHVRQRLDTALRKLTGTDELSNSSLESLSDALIKSIHVYLQKQSSSAVSLAYFFHQFLHAITSFTPSFISAHLPHISNRLLSLLPLTNHPLISSTLDLFTWPSLVSRLQEFSEAHNPRDLIANHIDGILESIQEGCKDGANRDMYLRTISVVVFTQPSTVPRILAVVKELFDKTRELEGVSCEDIAIWKHRDDSFPFVDVLKKERKDAKTETEKWEAELRAEIEAKRSQQRKKLTKEEHSLVQAQFKKEAEIRSRIQECYTQILNGLEMVRFVISGDKMAMSDYVPVTMEMLLPVLKLTTNIGGKLAVEFGWDVSKHAIATIEMLGQCLAPSIQHFSKLITTVRLRFMGIEGLPESYTADDFQLQQDRLVILIHDAVCSESTSSQEPLDPSSFSFIYPILEQIIRHSIMIIAKNHKVKSEETLDKAVTILAYHMKLGFSPLVPRCNILSLLCDIITTFPRFARLAQNAFVEFSESIGDSATTEEVKTILNALYSPSSIVRNAALKGMKHIGVTDDTVAEFTASVWVFMHDSDTNNSQIAKFIWEENEMEIGPGYLTPLLPLIRAKVDDVREAAASSYAEALVVFPNTFEANLEILYSDYAELIKPPVPQYDKFGMVIPESLIAPENWYSRCGIAQCLNSGASNFTASSIVGHFNFLLDSPGSVADENAAVRENMLKSGIKAIDTIGQKSVDLLLPMLESLLSKSDKVSSERDDNIRESIIVCLGTVSKHMDPTDERIKAILEKMLVTLETPSESVQIAVAQCLAPLAKILKDKIHELIKRMLDQTINGQSYAIRRGGAYGLAGLVKGKGISALKECEVMDTLKAAAEDKKMYEKRQGAVFAYEILSLTLGRLFEPYIIQILPILLTCFGDSSPDVREATADAAQVIMSNLSTHCVKLILPTVLMGLNDLKWRTKTGSIELLGATAYCAPKQLSISLPTIIPKLTEVMTDSHPQVQNSAKAALAKFTSVIQNPEIKSLLPTLLKALSDPTNHTNTALAGLVSTSFAHYIDSPSLALIAPVIERGLKERSTEVKRRSSHIIGNLTTLTDPKDLLPYVTAFVPLLKQVLVDPVPEARANAAKSLGMLVEKIGEANFPGLILELIQTLKSDSSGVDRQGAAQGLSEILSGLGMERFESLLPEFLANCSSGKPYVREGFMSLMIYLPMTFREKFVPYIPQVIPHILNGLADEFDYVRDASLKSAQILINRYAKKSVDLLLPQLEKGIFDENWRIRQSSVQLIGDILSKISGGLQLRTSIIVDEEEEEIGEGNETGRKEIINVLGIEHFNSLLAALYIIRSDVNAIVRQASVHVWKAIVVNTPKRLREILPPMMDMIIVSLASPNNEKRQVAATTLGDLVQKLGENVLREVFPILESRIKDLDENTRQGVCIGLKNILETCAEEYVEYYAPRAVQIVKIALVDFDPDVRESAAQVFDELYSCIGAKAIEQVVPPILAEFQKSQGDADQTSYALDGLKEILSVRSNVFPYLLPNLLCQPISSVNAKALSSLILVAGSAINRQLTKILDALIPALNQSEALGDIEKTLTVLLSSIDDSAGLQALMMYLHEKLKPDITVETRHSSCRVLGMFFTNNKKVDASSFVNDWISVLVSMLDVSVVAELSLVEQAWASFNAMIQSLKKDTLDKYLPILNRAVSNLISDVKIKSSNEKSIIDAFNLPKGLSPFLTTSLHGFMYASSDTRQLACSTISNLITFTDSEQLKPFVIQIAGPFIRLLGEKVPSALKASILECLTQLLNKVPASTRPFLPQLQRSFLKCLSDETQEVRLKASIALGVLVSLQSQIDPLIKELEKGLKDEQIEVKEIILATVWQIFDNAEGKISTVSQEIVKKSVLFEKLWTAHQEKVRWNAALVSGLLLSFLDESESVQFLRLAIAEAKLPETAAEQKHGLLAMIGTLVQKSPRLVISVLSDVQELLKICLDIDKPILNDMALTISVRLLAFISSEIAVSELLSAMLSRMGRSDNADTKRVGLTCLLALAVRHHEIIKESFAAIIPVAMQTIKDRNIPLKLTSERTVCAVLKIYETDAYIKKYAEENNDRAVMDYYTRVLINVAKTMTDETFRDEVESILGKMLAK